VLAYQRGRPKTEAGTIRSPKDPRLFVANTTGVENNITAETELTGTSRVSVGFDAPNLVASAVSSYSRIDRTVSNNDRSLIEHRVIAAKTSTTTTIPAGTDQYCVAVRPVSVVINPSKLGH
jgi:hypothetical protein